MLSNVEIELLQASKSQYLTGVGYACISLENLNILGVPVSSIQPLQHPDTLESVSIMCLQHSGVYAPSE